MFKSRYPLVLWLQEKAKKRRKTACGGPRGQVPHLQHLPLPKKFNTLSFYATELVFYRHGNQER